ncbi:MAG: hypothetical protein AAB214_20750 [Fibrobacterota bacterium]
MIHYGNFLWHLALSILLVIVWRLSVRLGRAMRDDVGPIVLFPVASGFVLVGGICQIVGSMAALPQWIPAAADLVGAGLGWYAARHSWGWLATELRQKSSTGG